MRDRFESRVFWGWGRRREVYVKGFDGGISLVCFSIRRKLVSLE